jgi:hypothetical protein
MALDWEFALSVLPLIIAFVFAWHYGDAWRYTENRAVSSIGWILFVIGSVGMSLLALALLLNLTSFKWLPPVASWLFEL